MLLVGAAPFALTTGPVAAEVVVAAPTGADTLSSMGFAAASRAGVQKARTAVPDWVAATCTDCANAPPAGRARKAAVNKRLRRFINFSRAPGSALQHSGFGV